MADVPHRENNTTFFRYPENSVVGVVDTPKNLSELLEALQSSSIDLGHIDVLCADKGIVQLDRSGRRHGLVAQLLRLVQFLGDEQDHLKRYEEALRSGKYLVSVKVGDNQIVKNRVADAIRAHGGDYLHYYGRNRVEKL